MTFVEQMQYLSELEPVFSTEVTPTNYSVARKEFLENTALIAPRFEYKNARSHVEEYELIRHAATIFRTYGANDAAQEMNLRDYATCAQEKIDLLNDLREYRSATTRCEQVRARDRITRLAQGLFGVPEEKTFRGILQKELMNVFERGLSPAEEQALLALADQVGFTLGDLRREPEGIMLTVDPTEAERARKMQTAETHAFKLAERCFRGTGEIPLMQDLTYYNGQVKVWRYIEALIDEPEKLWRNLFEAGKTDPTNPLHQELLKTVGWRDTDFGPQME